MKETFYKPLTPSLRADINIGLERNIAELKTCKRNSLVNMQIASCEAMRQLINGLPDGYPIPMNRRV